MGGVDHARRPRLTGDRTVYVLRNPSVGPAQAAPIGPLADPKQRRGALQAALCGMAEELLGAIYLLANRAPEPEALGILELRNARPGKPLVELAGEEELLAIAQRDTQDRAAAAPGAHHVDHFRPRGRR